MNTIVAKVAIKSKINILILMFLIFVSIRLSVEPSRIFDYAQYIINSDTIEDLTFDQIIRYEPLSSGLFAFFRLITENAADSISAYQYALTTFFLVSFTLLVLKSEVEWQGALLVLGLYGALMAFVTLRATPAIFFVLLALSQAAKGNWRCVLSCAVAVAFHISSLFVIPAIAMAFLQNRFIRWQYFFSLSRLIKLIYFGIIFLGLLADQIVKVFAVSAINLLPDEYKKYLSYFDNIGFGVSSAHYVYFACITLIVWFYLNSENEKYVRYRGYILVSYFTFCAMFISPVIAFRQSLFWTIPIIIFYPWSALKNIKSFNIFIVILSVCLMAFSFKYIIQ